MNIAGEHVGATFEGLQLGAEVVRGAYYEDCAFQACSLEKTRFTDCRFTDCRFERCDLVGVRFPDSSLVDCSFVGGRTMGVDFSDVRALSFRVRFQEVRLDFAVFMGLDLGDVVFDSCEMREVNLAETVLGKTRFTGCDLTGASLHHADLRGADLSATRGCSIDGTAKVGRTKVEPGTALEILRERGIRCDALEAIFGGVGA